MLVLCFLLRFFLVVCLYGIGITQTLWCSRFVNIWEISLNLAYCGVPHEDNYHIYHISFLPSSLVFMWSMSLLCSPIILSPNHQFVFFVFLSWSWCIWAQVEHKQIKRRLIHVSAVSLALFTSPVHLVCSFFLCLPGHTEE